jgi:hypothetical protein
MLVVWQGSGRGALKEWVGWTGIIRKGRSIKWHASQCNATVGHSACKPVHVLAIISYRQFQRERDSISLVGIHAFLLTRDSLCTSTNSSHFSTFVGDNLRTCCMLHISVEAAVLPLVTSTRCSDETFSLLQFEPFLLLVAMLRFDLIL